MDRAGEEELIITFHTTHDAIMGEKALLDAGIPVRVMPMPPRLGPACGIALRVSPRDREPAKSLLGKTIRGIFPGTPGGF